MFNALFLASFCNITMDFEIFVKLVKKGEPNLKLDGIFKPFHSLLVKM